MENDPKQPIKFKPFTSKTLIKAFSVSFLLSIILQIVDTPFLLCLLTGFLVGLYYALE